MRSAFIALLGSTVLFGSAAAQQQPQVTPPVIPQGTADAKAAVSECDRLVAYLEQAKPADAGVTVEQVRAWQQAAEPQPCRDNLRRLAENTGATSVPAPAPPAQADAAPTSPPAPTAGSQAAAPNAPQSAPSSAQVVVQQAQPTVTVRQPQPEIIVRQAPPLITVQQPQPEIIVRMPPPDVNVSMTRPDVQVSLPQPHIQVIAPQTPLQPNVQVDGQQPNVRFERTGEPQIIYQPAEGQPHIRFEQTQAAASNTPAPAAAPATPPAAQAQLNGDQRSSAAPAAQTTPANGPAQTGALASPGLQAVKASDLEKMALYNARGDKMGDVDEVLMGADNKAYILISHGGFLGLGQKKVALPSDQIGMRGDRLVADTLTDEQIRALPEFKESANFKEMEGDQTTSLHLVQ